MGPRHLDDARSPTMTTTTTVAVPTSCAALCTKLAELAQRIDAEFAQAGKGAAIRGMADCPVSLPVTLRTRSR